MFLGSVELSDELVLDGLETSPLLAYSQYTTIYGARGLQSTVLSGGRTLELGGGKHFSLTDIWNIQALISAAAPVTMTHERGTFTVRVLAVEPEPAVLRSNPDPDAIYEAVVTLMEV
jgi:hypothetical protein